VRWTIVVAIALLSGCASVPFSTKPPVVPATDQARIAGIDSWRVDGRVAIQRGDEGWSAKLRWTKQVGHFQMRLIAPLGRGTYQLAGDGSRVELIVPDGRKFTADDAEDLMRRHLGWSIPVDGAEYWMRGLIAPGSEPGNVRRDDAGQLTDLEQDGWRVSVLKRTAVAGMALPAKLFMHYGDLKVRIVVAKWDLNPA